MTCATFLPLQTLFQTLFAKATTTMLFKSHYTPIPNKVIPDIELTLFSALKLQK